MRAPMGRRSRLVLVAGTFLLGACTAVGDVGREFDESAPPPPGGAPPPPGAAPAPRDAPAAPPGAPPPPVVMGRAAAPAGSVDEIDLARGQGGAVELDDGARLSLPVGAVRSERARVRLVRSGSGVYEPSVEGELQGRAELRVPAGPVPPGSSAFLVVRSGAAAGAVLEAEARSDGFLYAHPTALSPVAVVVCPAGVATNPAGVLACLGQAGATQLPVSLQAQLARALGCGGVWPATPLLSPESACATAAGGRDTSSPVPAPTRPEAAPPLGVTLSENPVICDGQRRPFGVVSGAQAGETVGFRAAGIGELLPGEADGAGQVTVHWRCEPSHAGRTWSVEASGTSSGRTVEFSFTGAPPTAGGPVPAGGLQVALLGPSFPCDGTRQPAGTLAGAQPGERVTFSAPGLGPLLPGTADASGRLTVHWRCDRAHAGWTWTLQATGESSGRTGTFSLLGA